MLLQKSSKPPSSRCAQFLSASLKWFAVVRESVTRWVSEDASTQAAAVAFFAVFTLVPMSLVLQQIFVLLVGAQAGANILSGQLAVVAGTDAARYLNDTLEVALRDLNDSDQRFISILSLMVGASATFMQLRTAMNNMRRIKNENTAENLQYKKFSWMWSLLAARFASLAIVMGLGFLMLAWLMLDTVLSLALTRYLSDFEEVMSNIARSALTMILLTATFYALLRYLPDQKLHSQSTWRGACAGALLFMSGRALFSTYFVKWMNASVFGAAGALVVLLGWIFFAAAIFLLAAQIAYVHAEQAELSDGN